MGLRTIMIFPEFEHMDILNDIRNQYDPLCHLVKPHITLVFPFEDSRTNEEIKQILDECFSDITGFSLALQRVSRQADIYGNYLFLNVVKGYEEIVQIHHRLYQALWPVSREKTADNDQLSDNEMYHMPVYIPHMTIGNLRSAETMEEAYSKIRNFDTYFETYINKVSVEMIGEHGESIIVIEEKLK